MWVVKDVFSFRVIIFSYEKSVNFLEIIPKFLLKTAIRLFFVLIFQGNIYFSINFGAGMKKNIYIVPIFYFGERVVVVV